MVLSTLLYSSETWTPYRKQISQLDVFHKRCLRAICSFTLKDKISNAKLFTLCKISNIESFLIQSQLRWAGHVMRMDDDRIPKQLLYGQLDRGRRNVGRPWLRYKDKIKSNLQVLNIEYNNIELTAKDRRKWIEMCDRKIKAFSAFCIEKLKEARVKSKNNTEQCGAKFSHLYVCHHCGRHCKSLAGLKCHIRLSECRHEF